MCRLGYGKPGLCPRSSLSFLVSFLSTFAILALSFHLTLFALRIFSKASPELLSKVCSWASGFRDLGSFFSVWPVLPGVGREFHLSRVDVKSVCDDLFPWDPVLLLAVLVYLVLFPRVLLFEDREE